MKQFISIALASTALSLTGCATHQLNAITKEAHPGVVTIKKGGLLMSMNIRIDGKWEKLKSGATVPPGTYWTTMLGPANVATSSFEIYSNRFTAVAGDVVTFYRDQFMGLDYTQIHPTVSSEPPVKVDTRRGFPGFVVLSKTEAVQLLAHRKWSGQPPWVLNKSGFSSRSFVGDLQWDTISRIQLLQYPDHAEIMIYGPAMGWLPATMSCENEPAIYNHLLSALFALCPNAR